MSLLLVFSCTTSKELPIDKRAFRNAQRIIITPSYTVTKTKGLFVLFPDYLNKVPNDSTSLAYVNNQVLIYLYNKGYTNITIAEAINFPEIRKTADSVTYFIKLGSINYNETKDRETQTEPNSKQEETIVLRALTGNFTCTTEIGTVIGDSPKVRRNIVEVSQSETYSGYWVNSVGFLKKLIDANKTWTFKYTIYPIDQNNIYYILDQLAAKLAFQMDNDIINLDKLKKKNNTKR